MSVLFKIVAGLGTVLIAGMAAVLLLSALAGIVLVIARPLTAALFNL